MKSYGKIKRLYLDITKDELKEIKDFSDKFDIELSASIFDQEKLSWCEDLNFKTIKLQVVHLLMTLIYVKKLLVLKKRLLPLWVCMILGMVLHLTKNVEYL